MTTLVSEIRPGAYFDSVVLMQLQRGLLTLPGVQDAGVVMATPVNIELLAASGLRPEVKAGPDDLLLVIKADTEAAGQAALGQADTLLARRRSATSTAFLPKSLEAAAGQLTEARWVLISVPGRFAAGVAREALRLGKNVFLYSDNVPVEDEVDLKRAALARGLLVMGPDCGTAIIGGIGFGFANRVRPGNIGLIAASGTGLQAVTSAIDALGGGVSQAIGIGSRDLKADVGAVSARQALDVLRRDPETQVIVLISKPPEPAVAASLLSAARACGKPVVIDLIGLAPGTAALHNLHFATSLEQTAQLAVELASKAGRALSKEPIRTTGGKYVRGLFSGGTLAYETVLSLQTALRPLFTNVPVSDEQRLDDPLQSRDHTVLDLGAETFTVGRLHPMIDNDLRLRRLRQEAADPATGVILLDVVLGEGAHPDPSSELAPAVAEAVKREGLEVVVVVVGTDTDPQRLGAQVERFRAAGARVHTSLGRAIEDVVGLVGQTEEPLPTQVPLEFFRSPAAINVGLESFFESLNAQGAPAIQVDWHPPAGGDERLIALLAKMKGSGTPNIGTLRS
jgi:FdrA protein